MAMTEVLPRRRLGSTGILVSVLGLGTVKFGRNTQVKNRIPDGFELPSDAQLSHLLEISREHGLNLLDTAPAYGTAEARLGALLRGRRDHFVIATKAGETFDGSLSSYDFSATAIRQSVEASLRRLSTDRVECILLHLPKDDLDVLTGSAALETLDRLKSEGKTQSYGASTHTVAAGRYAVHHADVVMVALNPLYLDQMPVLELARKLDKGVLIKKGLFSGHLDSQDPMRTVQRCCELALGNDATSALVTGTVNADHLRENIVTACQVANNYKTSIASP